MTNANAQELAAIEAAVVNYLTSFVRMDGDAVVGCYTDDGVLMAPGRPATVGKANLGEVYQAVWDVVTFDMKYTVHEVLQTSEDWGLVRSSTEGTETINASGEVIPARYQELFVMRKEAGKWLMARYCTCKID